MIRKSSRKPHHGAHSSAASRITPNEVNVLRLFVKSTLGQPEMILPEAAVGALTVDFRRGTVTRNGKPIASSAKERELLRYLLLRRGEVVTRDEIFRDVWRYANPPTSRSIDNYILALRKKIEPDPSTPKHLLTLRGAGYQLV